MERCGLKPYYEHAGITIYHGDCRDVLEEWEGLRTQSFDLLLTDPPYGIEMSKGFGGFGGFGTPIPRKAYADTWDSERPSPETLIRSIRICRQAIIWGGNFFADVLQQSKHWYVWDKLNTMPSFGDCELAWTNIPRNSVKKVTIEWNGLLGKEQARDHPTQKPESLFRWCLMQVPTCRSVLDPFMGSGTTLVAAKRLGKQATGIEREERYCEIAAKRLSQEVLSLEFSA